MTISFADVLEALLWSAVAGLATWFLLLSVRRRTYVGLLVSLVLTGTAASTGALYGGMHSMLVPMLLAPSREFQGWPQRLETRCS